MCISTLLEPTGNQESSEAGNSGLEGQEQNPWGERWGEANRSPLTSFLAQASGYWSA